MATFGRLDANPNPYNGCIAGAETGHPHCGGAVTTFPAACDGIATALMPQVVLCDYCLGEIVRAFAGPSPTLAGSSGQQVPADESAPTNVPAHENPVTEGRYPDLDADDDELSI